MKIAYVDCFSGISGDMFLGALVSAGASVEMLNEQLHTLQLPENFAVTAHKIHKGALAATQVEVAIEEHEHGHGHHHRHPAEIAGLIEASPLSARVKAASLTVFQKLAEAEAAVHGVAVEEVHFHEVGATDSIVDIVGAAIGLEMLAIERLYASALPYGSGTVNSQHGLLPLPAPATLELLMRGHAPVIPTSAKVELVTPTGAALLTSLATFEAPAMTLTATGIGAGQRELPWANVLRLLVGESETANPQGMVLLETNLDDMNPQMFGVVMNHLFAAGALDVFLTPIYMKKNRPGTLLAVIARKADEGALAHIILHETTTFGLRVQPVFRYEAGRRMQPVETAFGMVPVKVKILDDKDTQFAPEYEVCLRLAEEHGVSVLEVYQAAQNAASAG